MQTVFVYDDLYFETKEGAQAQAERDLQKHCGIAVIYEWSRDPKVSVTRRGLIWCGTASLSGLSFVADIVEHRVS
jgi:ferredoxin-like protein FixX